MGGGTAATRIMLLIPSSLFFKLEVPPSSNLMGWPDESPPVHSFRGLAPECPIGEAMIFPSGSLGRVALLLACVDVNTCVFGLSDLGSEVLSCH